MMQCDARRRFRNAVRRGPLLAMLLASTAPAADTFSRRLADPQNTANVGDEPALRPETVTDLQVTTTIPTDRPVNATPIVFQGLLFVGDYGGFFYVVDLETGERLIKLDTGAQITEGTLGRYFGIQ